MPQSNYTRKAVIYRRVSGKRQKDNFSLRNQDTQTAQYCERKGLTIDRIFTDVGTGLSAKGRANFIGMSEYAMDEANGTTDVVFNDIDRFARNYREFFEYIDRVFMAGITLHSVIDDEEYDYDSEEKWTDKAVNAQRESKRTSKRVKQGQRIATELGHHIGPPPWGYMLEHETDERDETGYHAIAGKLIPDPELWPHVLEFWRLAVDGYTPGVLARHMRLNNVPSPRGKPWTDDAARGIMRNRKYIGTNFRGVNPKSRLPGPPENAPPVIIEDNHQAAVSPKDWQAVNDGIDGRHRSKGPTRSHSSPNPLSQRIKCGHCAARGVDSNLEIHRSGGKAYLRCSRKKKMGADFCEFKSANLNTLLRAISDRIVHHFLTPENLQSVIDGVNHFSRSMLEERQVQMSSIGERKRIINTEIKNINDVLRMAGTQANNLQTLLKDLAELEKERAALENQGKRISDDTEEALLFVNDQAGIIETAMDYKTWTDPEDPESLRQLFQVFIQQVEVFELEKGATDQRVDIYYDLRVFKESGQDGSDAETIHIGKKKSLTPSDKICGFGMFTGIAQSMTVDSASSAGPPRVNGGLPFQHYPSKPSKHRCAPLRDRWSPATSSPQRAKPAYGDVEPAHEFPMDAAQKFLDFQASPHLIILGADPNAAWRYTPTGWTLFAFHQQRAPRRQTPHPGRRHLPTQGTYFTPKTG